MDGPRWVTPSFLREHFTKGDVSWDPLLQASVDLSVAVNDKKHRFQLAGVFEDGNIVQG